MNAARSRAGASVPEEKGTSSGPACPICGKPRADAYRPFCSKRCADVDLGRWLNGSYAIPVTDDDDEDGEGGVAQDEPRRDDKDG